MKRIVYLVLLVISVLGCFFAFTACSEKTENNEKVENEVERVTVRYYAEEGGKIEGKTPQRIIVGESTEIVKAVPNTGYLFVHWSDGVETPERVDRDVKQNFSVSAIFTKQEFAVHFEASENGYIEGEQDQTVLYGESISTVTAIGNRGYCFSGWSDEWETATRTDIVQNNISAIAYFEEIEKQFNLEYGLATGNCSIEKVAIKYFSWSEYIFPIPEREHFSFRGWYLGELQVSDEQGNPIASNEVFDSELTELTAKWEANENFTFKVLLAYVTEVKGSFLSVDGSEVIEVDYKMSELDRKICHLITKQVKKTLDEMMEGIVTFEVDEHFIREPLTKKNFRSYFRDGWFPEVCYSNQGKEIPEMVEKKPYYQAVLTTFCLNDWEDERKLTHATGLTRHVVREGKTINIEAGIVYEGVLGSLIVNGEPIENLFDESYWRWEDVVSTYVHELIHTIEFRSDVEVGLHETMSSYYDRGIYDSAIHEKHYLLGCAYVDGKYVGIPYDFWGEDEKRYKNMSS